MLTRLTAWVWAVLLIGLFVHGYCCPWAHTVYDIYGPSARNWWAGRDLYAPIVKTWCEEPGVVAQTTDYYRYSPFFAVALTPFAVLPDQLGNPLWKLFNCSFFAAGLWVASRRLLPGNLGQAQRASLFLLVLPLSLHSMYNGQANLIVVGAILLGLSAAASQCWTHAAAWLALATLTKGYPLALGLLVSALYPRFLWRYAAALSCGLLLPFAAQHPWVVAAQTLSWWEHLNESSILMRERLRSIDKLLDVCGYPVSAGTFAAMGLAAGTVVLVLCVLQGHRTEDRRERLIHTLMLFSLWVVLFGPATEACTYVVMAPPAAWALIEAFRRRKNSLAWILLIASIVLMGPLSTDLFGSAVRTFAHRFGTQPLGAILFLIYVGAETVKRCRPSHELRIPPIHGLYGWRATRKDRAGAGTVVHATKLNSRAETHKAISVLAPVACGGILNT
jgi:hypothetical protein